jgi:hypothetical protein
VIEKGQEGIMFYCNGNYKNQNVEGNMKSLDETHSFDKGETFDRVSIVAASVLAFTTAEMEIYHLICKVLNLNTIRAYM